MNVTTALGLKTQISIDVQDRFVIKSFKVEVFERPDPWNLITNPDHYLADLDFKTYGSQIS